MYMRETGVLNTVLCGDALSMLKTLPAESVDCCVTSPPYWSLRDYGTADWQGGDVNCDHKKAKEKSRYDYEVKSKKQVVKDGNSGTDAPRWKDVCPDCGAKRVDKQLGLEPTFQEYITKLCDIFDEVKRVLKKTGTCWVVIGDTYAGTMPKKPGDFGHNSKVAKNLDNAYAWQGTKNQVVQDKSLCSIPSRFAIEMANRGWILRNELIWYKPNCMPSSASDRFTVDFEKVFFFVKNKKYWFEQQYEELANPNRENFQAGSRLYGENPARNDNDLALRSKGFKFRERNKRCVWKVATKPYKEAHFATYPPDLIDPMIKAGCPEFVCKKCGKAREKIIERKRISRKDLPKDDPRYRPNDYNGAYGQINGKADAGYSEINAHGYTDCNCNAGFEGGIVLDPFMGSGTTGEVAIKQNKKFIGIELNPEYIELANKRIDKAIRQKEAVLELPYSIIT